MPGSRTGLARAKPGGKGYTVAGVSYVPGVSGSIGNIAARDKFLPVRSNGMRPVKARAKAKVQTGVRQANRINVGTYVTAEGPIEFLLNAVAGYEYIEAALGAQATVGSITGTAVGSVVTANGTSDIPVTGAFTAGMPVYVGAGAAQEPTEVLSYTAGHLITTALGTNAAASNVAVSQNAGVKLAGSALAATYDDDMERLAVERVFGSVWGYLFPDTQIDKLSLALDGDFVKVTADAYSTAPFSRLASGALTAWAPGNTFLKRAKTPFVFQQASIALPGDPTGALYSTLTQAIGVTSFKIDYSNALQKFRVGGASQMNAIPGDDGSCAVEFNVIDTAWYPDLWENAMAGDIGVALVIGFHRNFGTAASPNWGSVVFRVPFAMIDDTMPEEGIDKITEFQHKFAAQIEPGFDQDLLQCFYVLPT